MRTDKQAEFEIIAHVRTDFKEKFGIPRQSGLAKSARGRVVFEKRYQVPEAFRGLEDFSHIWILWQFSKAQRTEWTPTVRPPVLGGNKRVGVFATRSPYRPNSIGMSCVCLERIEYTDNEGPVLHVLGVDILDNTPVFDVKPYIPYADCLTDATAGFSKNSEEWRANVRIECANFFTLSEEYQKEIMEILANDPRPSYIEEERVYGMKYGEYEIKFRADSGGLAVISAEKF